MHIDTDVLFAWGAVAKKYKKGDFIFYEGDPCRYYHQIMKGKVKMCCFNDEGRIFSQGQFTENQSFGEPPLFINQPYPACAIAETDSVILQLTKDTLFKLLTDYPFLPMQFLKGFAQRIYDKSFNLKNISSPNPEERIMGFMKKYKTENKSDNGRIQLPQTRQQLADSLGLRVETVIRTLKKMEENGLVEIKRHKVFF